MMSRISEAGKYRDDNKYTKSCVHIITKRHGNSKTAWDWRWLMYRLVAISSLLCCDFFQLGNALVVRLLANGGHSTFINSFLSTI